MRNLSVSRLQPRSSRWWGTGMVDGQRTCGEMRLLGHDGLTADMATWYLYSTGLARKPPNSTTTRPGLALLWVADGVTHHAEWGRTARWEYRDTLPT